MPVLYEGGAEFLAGNWSHYSLHTAAPAGEDNELDTVARVAADLANAGRDYTPATDLTFTVPVDHPDIVAVGVWNAATNGDFLGYIVLAEPVVYASLNRTTLTIPRALLTVSIGEPNLISDAGAAVLYGLTERTDVFYAALHRHVHEVGGTRLGPELTAADNPGYGRDGVRFVSEGTFARAVNLDRILWIATAAWTNRPERMAIYDANTDGNLLFNFEQDFPPAPASSGQQYTIADSALQLDINRGLSLPATGTDGMIPTPPAVRDDIEDFAHTETPDVVVPDSRLDAAAIARLTEALTGTDRLDYAALKDTPDPVTDADLGSATDEASNTDVPPSRRAVAAVTDRSLTGLSVLDGILMFNRRDETTGIVSLGITDLLEQARISGRDLIFTRENGGEFTVTLPDSGTMADGVVTAAAVSGKIVTLTTSTGDTVTFDLTAFLLAADQRFTETLATKLEGIAEGAQVNESIAMLFDDARIENNSLILTRVNDADITLDLGDATDLTGFFNNALVLNNNIVFSREGRPDLVVPLPAQQGGGLESVNVSPDNYITGNGSAAMPLGFDDEGLLQDWIGDYDTPIPGAVSFSGTAAAAPGNYSWRNMGVNHQVVSATHHQPNRRFQGDVALSVTRIVGAGAVGYRVVFNDAAGTNVGIVKFADTGEDTQRFDVPTGAGTAVAARLQVQGAGEYSADVTYTNRRLHDGDGVLKDEIQAEIHAGTQHLVDNAFSQVEFDETSRDLTMTTEGGDEQAVNIPEADISDAVVGAEINSGVLTLTQEDGTTIVLTLPTSTAVADGVITSATLNTANKVVTITTDQGDTVALNLSALALLSDVEPWARGVGQIPTADLDDIQVITVEQLDDTPDDIGEAGQVLAVNAGETGYEFVDPASGGAPILLGSANVEIVFGNVWTETGIVFGDHKFYILSFGTVAGVPGGSHLVDGDLLRSLDVGTAFTGDTQPTPDPRNPNPFEGQVLNIFDSGAGAYFYIGRTAGGTLLVRTSSAADDPMPLALHALTGGEASSGGGGGGGNATHLVGQGDFDVTRQADWALEANSADITLDDSDWFHVAVRDNNLASSYERVLGDDWRGLAAGTYGTHIGAGGSQRIQVAFIDSSGGSHTAWLGRTADNKVLFSSASTSDDAMPLIVRGENEATGGGSGGSSTYAGLEDTGGLGTAGQLQQTNTAEDALEPVSPATVLNPLVPAVFRTGNTDTIDPSKIPVIESNTRGVTVATTSFTRNASTGTSRGLANDWELPETGRYYLHVYSASAAGTTNAESDTFDVETIRALDAVTVSGTPIESSDTLTRSNSMNIRLEVALRGNQAVSIALSRDSQNRILLRPLHTSFPTTPMTVVIKREQAQSVGTTGGGTGGGATGQTDSDAANNFDVVRGTEVLHTFTNATLSASGDGSEVLARLLGDASDIPVVTAGNVMILEIEAGTTSGGSIDLYTELADGTFSYIGAAFPATGETIRVEVPYSQSNGTHWRLAYGLNGVVDFNTVGGVIRTTLIRYHDIYEVLMESTDAADLVENWEFELPRPIDPQVYDYLIVEVGANEGQNRQDFWLPSGYGQIDQLRPFTRATIPGNWYREHHVWTAHAIDGPLPALIKNSWGNQFSGAIGFVFGKEGENDPITYIRGVGVINHLNGHNVRIRITAKRRQ